MFVNAQIRKSILSQDHCIQYFYACKCEYDRRWEWHSGAYSGTDACRSSLTCLCVLIFLLLGFSYGWVAIPYPETKACLRNSKWAPSVTLFKKQLCLWVSVLIVQQCSLKNSILVITPFQNPTYNYCPHRGTKHPGHGFGTLLLIIHTVVDIESPLLHWGPSTPPRICMHRCMYAYTSCLAKLMQKFEYCQIRGQTASELVSFRAWNRFPWCEAPTLNVKGGLTLQCLADT